MTITNGYITVAALKGRLFSVDNQADTADDSKFESIIEAVSRGIDEDRGRRFFTTTSDETRYYTAEAEDRLTPENDILSVTSIAVDTANDGTYSTTITTAEYLLCPFNALLDGKPYEVIEARTGGTPFVLTKKGIKIVGKFGYCALANVPRPITEACLLICERIWGRKDAVFGVTGSADLGTREVIASLIEDAEVQYLLNFVPRRARRGWQDFLLEPVNYELMRSFAP